MSITINLNKCDGCGLCIEKCPNNVLELKDISQEDYNRLNFVGKLKIRFKGSKRPYVINKASCNSCKTCQRNCHERAIKVN